MGIFISGTISGAHLNPAVSIALAATGRFPWAKVPAYILAKLIGAFLGAAIVFAVYHAKWMGVDPGLTSTAGVFTTFQAVPGLRPGFWGRVLHRRPPPGQSTVRRVGRRDWGRVSSWMSGQRPACAVRPGERSGRAQG